MSSTWPCHGCGAINSNLTPDFCPICGSVAPGGTVGFDLPRGTVDLANWTCLNCGASNSYLTPIFCPICNSRRNEPESRTDSTQKLTSNLSPWTCLNCDASNNNLPEFCPICGYRRNETESKTWSSVQKPDTVWEYPDQYTPSTVPVDADATTPPLAPVVPDEIFLKALNRLLWDEPKLHKLYIDAALGVDRIPKETLLRALHRLLKQFSTNLRSDAETLKQIQIAEFLGAKIALISWEICAKVEWLATVATGGRRTPSKKVEADHEDDVLGTFDDEDEDEEIEYDAKTEAGLRNMNQSWDLSIMTQFITSSSALSALYGALKDFVHPTFRDSLVKLAKRAGKNLSAPDRARWFARSPILAKELCQAPQIISTSRDNDGGWINNFKTKVEIWTGETWDWWPLSRPQNPLASDQARIRWTCECGEKRWTEVPDHFARGLERLMRQYASTTSEKSSTHPSAAPPKPQQVTSAPPPPPPPSSSNIPSSHNTPHMPLSTTASSPPTNVTPLSMQFSPLWVLLVVQTAGDFRLAQIQSKQPQPPIIPSNNAHSPLLTRRAQFEKFDELEIAPRKKDEYPDQGNRDYIYNPKPMAAMPISEHEFKKRFHACAPPILCLRHPFRQSRMCKCTASRAKSHNDELLVLLPKKISQLDEHSDQRETFWGLHAKQEPVFWRLLFYNLLCVAPSVVFFFLWIFWWDHPGDFQNASVPLSIMVPMLLFLWGYFFSSLSYGKDR
ncbi:hypothetical protein K505DRAFT_412520 [Melanomma pulvis-pyrius CBS 109.77]|uniref:RanBP2-type domain-containing protein n=1 Tax=Melanomma pulvis-pyrius CBS 109.77 TaxID=1314802 RepID=A0A6A6XWX4_9PLEO|nr:hypothetical protein K505DRAFT_412520 [Melanomma pulvis-pyrius CBS 109.77]